MSGIIMLCWLDDRSPLFPIMLISFLKAYPPEQRIIVFVVVPNSSSTTLCLGIEYRVAISSVHEFAPLRRAMHFYAFAWDQFSMAYGAPHVYRHSKPPLWTGKELSGLADEVLPV